MRGTVLTGRNNIFTVECPDGTLLCRLKGKTLALEERSYNPLAPGDEVELSSVDVANATGVIEARLLRRNEISRYNHKRAAQQTLAANVDLVAAVVSLRRPEFRSRFVDRVLVIASYHEVMPLLIVTKLDLGGDDVDESLAPYRAIGVETFVVSATTGEGIPELRDRLGTHRTALIGQSGVGKSTLVNALLERHEQDVGVMDRFHRGTHTTSAGRLLAGNGFELVDTPGVRELDCRHVPLEDLDACYPELAAIRNACDHSDCSHRHEPGCAVRAATDAGMIPAERYESYVRLYSEIEELMEQE
jgi:ribosome biogenesis GTPase